MGMPLLSVLVLLVFSSFVVHGMPENFFGGGENPWMNFPNVFPIPGGESPTTPEIPRIPDIPYIPRIPIPGFPRQEAPRSEVPTPEVPRSEVPRQVPEAPKSEVPEFPRIPQVPKSEVPKVPELPQVPEAPKSEVPKVPQPEVPERPRPIEVPQPEVPNVPEQPRPIQIPEIPEYPKIPQLPEVPKVPQPEVPQLPRPEPRTSEEPGVDIPIPGGVINIPPGIIPPGIIPGAGRQPIEQRGELLRPGFYAQRCPNAEAIVRRVVQQAVEQEPRMAASLIRLHFHDCFVQGCDGSILLDDAPNVRSEKNANPNRNSARGFEVVDQIKAALEQECEGVVSCADVLAIAARDSVVLTEGPSWEVLLGRRDSLNANFLAANRDIPPPNSTLPQLIAAFAKKGLSLADMVTLSGSHTIGNARCPSFSQRLNARRPDPTLNPIYRQQLRQICPRGGNPQVTTVLDVGTPKQFDNHYYKNLQVGLGLLKSDQVLLAPSNPNPQQLVSNALVVSFIEQQEKFFAAFAASMIRMGNIRPLVGEEGQIRRNCRYVNQQAYEQQQRP